MIDGEYTCGDVRCRENPGLADPEKGKLAGGPPGLPAPASSFDLGDRDRPVLGVGELAVRLLLLVSASDFLGFLFTGSPLSELKRDDTPPALLLDWMRLASSPSL